MIELPKDAQWKSTHNGPLFGSAIYTKNLSFDMDGYLALARKTMGIYTTTQDADFGAPLVILSDATLFYVVTTGHIFSFDMSGNSVLITELSLTRQPALGFDSDAVWFQGRLHVSGQSDINDFASGSWNNPKRVTDLGTTYPHPLCNFENRQTLLVGDGNVVRQYSTSYVRDTANELTLPPEYIVTGIRFKQNTAYIATRHQYGQEARLFTWTGSGLQFNSGYGIGSDWLYSLCEYKNGMALITSAGQLRYFNGGGFEELDKLPVYYTPYSWASSAAVNNLIGNVASRGMQALGDIIYVNINGALRNSQFQYPGRFLPNQPSGVWAFDPKVGLYHKAGFVYNRYNVLVPTEIASGNLVFSTPHQAQTGDAFLYASAGGITSLTEGQIYYALVTGTNTIKPSLSAADALAGRAITMTGTASTDAFIFDRYESTGASLAVTAGPVHVLSRLHPNLMQGSELMFGGRVSDSGMSSISAFMSLGMGRNRGSFVTPQIPAAQVTDTFQKLISFFNPLNLGTDQIIVKHRTSERFGLPTPLSYGSSATWTSSTTFTFDATQKDVKSVIVGDEITIVDGAGAGYTAHITAIDTTTPTSYIYTLDETMPVSSGRFDFVVDNWTKWKVLTSTSDDNNTGFADVAVGKRGTWVQFKFELRGYETTMESFQSINTTNKPSV